MTLPHTHMRTHTPTGNGISSYHHHRLGRGGDLRTNGVVMPSLYCRLRCGKAEKVKENASLPCLPCCHTATTPPFPACRWRMAAGAALPFPCNIPPATICNISPAAYAGFDGAHCLLTIAARRRCLPALTLSGCATPTYCHDILRFTCLPVRALLHCLLPYHHHHLGRVQDSSGLLSPLPISLSVDIGWFHPHLPSPHGVRACPYTYHTQHENCLLAPCPTGGLLYRLRAA